MARTTSSYSPGTSPGFLDAAETFAESDVLTGHNKTISISESVELASAPTGSAVSFDPNLRNYNHCGFQIEPVEPIAGFEVTLSPDSAINSNDVLEVRTEEGDGSTGSLLKSKDISGKSPGDTVQIYYDTTSDNESRYRLLHYDPSNNFQIAYGSGDPTKSTPEFDVISGIRSNQHHESGDVYAFDKVEAIQPAKNGTVSIEWPYPPDVYDWDVAKFQATKDGETVDVYVEEFDGSSWVEIAGPISRGDDLPADPGRNVRYRVDLSRADTANNPTLDAIYRRYTV